MQTNIYFLLDYLIASNNIQPALELIWIVEMQTNMYSGHQMLSQTGQ